MRYKISFSISQNASEQHLQHDKTRFARELGDKIGRDFPFEKSHSTPSAVQHMYSSREIEDVHEMDVVVISRQLANKIRIIADDRNLYYNDSELYNMLQEAFK